MTKLIIFFTVLFMPYSSVFSQKLDKIIENYLSARGQSGFNELNYDCKRRKGISGWQFKS